MNGVEPKKVLQSLDSSITKLKHKFRTKQILLCKRTVYLSLFSGSWINDFLIEMAPDKGFTKK